MIEHLAELRTQSGLYEDVLARLIPFSSPLAHALASSVGVCRAADTPYYTAHVLLALVRLPDGVVSRCLDAARPNFADEVRTRLTAYAMGLKEEYGGRFVPFDWSERAEVHRAQLFALRTGKRVVSAAALFLAVLQTPSNTASQLRSRTTEAEFELIHGAAAAAVAADEASSADGTPGVVFDGML